MLQAAAKACTPLQKSSHGRNLFGKKEREETYMSSFHSGSGVSNNQCDVFVSHIEEIYSQYAIHYDKGSSVWVYPSYSTSWPHFKIIFKNKWKNKGYSYTPKN